MSSLDVGGGGVESHLLPGILETQVGGLHAGAGSLGVLALRVAENQRLHRGAPDRGLAGGEAVRIADLEPMTKLGIYASSVWARAACAFCRSALREFDGTGVALRQVHHRGERNLRRARADAARKRESGQCLRPQRAGIHFVACTLEIKLESCAG